MTSIVISSPQRKNEELEAGAKFHRFRNDKSPFKKKPREVPELDISRRLIPNTSSERSCTDICGLVFFILITIFFVILSIVALSTGNPDVIASPIDTDKNICGVGSAADYPFIYFANPSKASDLHRTFCVKSCPKSIMTDFFSKFECLPNSITKDCSFSFNPPVLTYDNIEFLGKLCLPRSLKYFKQSVDKMFPPKNDSNLKDLRSSWPIIICGLVLAVVIAMIFSILTKSFTKCVVFTYILLYFVCLIGLIVFCYNNSQPSKSLDRTQNFQDPELLKGYASDTSNSPEIYYSLFIIFIVIAVISLLLLIIFRKKVLQTIEFIDISSDFVEENTLILLVPVVSFIIMLIYCLCWINVAIYLYSMGEILDLPIEQRLPFAQYQTSSIGRFLFVLHFLSFFYFMSVIITFTQYIVSGTYTYWYFMTGENVKDNTNNPNSSKDPNERDDLMGFTYTPWRAIKENTYAAFRFHFGSLCLGALLILVFGPISLALVYLREMLQRICKGCASFCCCCTMLYEALFYWITGNAYTLIAYQGKHKDTNFKKGGYIASRLVDIDENFELYGVTAALGGLFITLGNVFICMGVVLVCYVILSQSEPYVTVLASPVFPSIVIGIVAYLSSSAFMSIYATTVESYLICLFIDEYWEIKEKGDTENKIKNPKMEKFIEVHSPKHLKKNRTEIEVQGKGKNKN